MRPADTLSFAWISLTAGRVRSVLILFAMSIGVAAVIVLTGVGDGARQYVVEQFSSLGTNLVIVFPGRSETASGSPSTFTGETPRNLTLADALALERLPTVRFQAPMVLGESGISHKGLERRVPVIGTTASLLKIHHLELGAGRFLSSGDPRQSRPVCILGAKVRQELFGTEQAVGRLVRIGEYRCRVIGVLASEGRSLGLDTQELVIVPVAFAQMLFNTEKLFRILIEGRGRAELDALKKQVLTKIAHRHHGEKDVTVITQDSVLATFDRIFTMLTRTVAGIAGISLAVAGILIMNVMLVSISRRTTEIGLLKAVGAGNGEVVLLIVTEAMLLAGVGGLLGIGIGFIGGWLVEQLYPDLSASPPLWAIGSSWGWHFLPGFSSACCRLVALPGLIRCNLWQCVDTLEWRTLMLVGDLIRLTFSTLRAKPLRSALTALGIAVSIAAVILLTSLGQGLQRYVLAEFTQFGTNLIVIDPGRVTTMGTSLGVLGSERLLTLEDTRPSNCRPRYKLLYHWFTAMGKLKQMGAGTASLCMGWVRKWIMPFACLWRGVGFYRPMIPAAPVRWLSWAIRPGWSSLPALTLWAAGLGSSISPAGSSV